MGLSAALPSAWLSSSLLDVVPGVRVRDDFDEVWDTLRSCFVGLNGTGASSIFFGPAAVEDMVGETNSFARGFSEMLYLSVISTPAADSSDGVFGPSLTPIADGGVVGVDIRPDDPSVEPVSWAGELKRAVLVAEGRPALKVWGASKLLVPGALSEASESRPGMSNRAGCCFFRFLGSRNDPPPSARKVLLIDSERSDFSASSFGSCSSDRSTSLPLAVSSIPSSLLCAAASRSDAKVCGTVPAAVLMASRLALIDSTSFSPIIRFALAMTSLRPAGSVSPIVSVVIGIEISGACCSATWIGFFFFLDFLLLFFFVAISVAAMVEISSWFRLESIRLSSAWPAWVRESSSCSAGCSSALDLAIADWSYRVPSLAIGALQTSTLRSSFCEKIFLYLPLS